MHEIMPIDWRDIEMIAETHPYIVALLNGCKIYSCTGTIINERTVLTSGTCVQKDLNYIAVALAAFDIDVDNRTLFKVASKRLHEDYNVDLSYDSNENITRMVSNIGLVFTIKPYLELFVNSATVGGYLIPDLRKAELNLVGYGNLAKQRTVLQSQIYHQTSCMNPEWYNCFCGIENVNAPKPYAENFGEGAPLLYGSSIVGIATFPSGSLALEGSHIIYNIFTFTNAYVYWINKPDIEIPLKLISQETQTSYQKRFEVECVYLCVIVSKMIS